MNRYTSHTLRCLWVLLLLLLYRPASVYSQNYYPVHVNVQVLPPYGVYLTDYYSSNRDRLIVTLLNRDKQQRPLQVKLRVRIKNSSSFQLSSRDELYYPMITLESGVPLRLTGIDLGAYLSDEKIRMEGRLNEGKLPTGMTEFSVQALDYATGRVLSDWGTGRAWLEMKQPPTLNIPLKNEQVAYRTPQQIRFQWMPRHQGLAGTEYEFVLKELPDNGSEPQSAFSYGQEIYRTRTRFTTLNYTQLEPSLIPGKMYGWQIRAIAKDGADEIGMFENNGFSEVGWFELNDNCPAPTQVTAKGGYRKMTLTWNSLPEQRSFVVEYRPKSEHSLYEWTSVRTFDTSLTAYELTPGWKYEYRVGALCLTDKPVYSSLGEITLSVDNEERLAQCGVWPDVDFSNKEGKENLSVGEVVIIGRDFPMTVTQISPQGNGWYSGKGRLTLPWIFDMPVAVQFSRLRINTDNRQIDGEVETETDPNASNIGNTNELDYGGKPTTAAKVIIVTQELDFTIPAVPEATFDPESGELIIFDTDGEPHVIATQKNEGESIFPMIVEDADGNKYQIDAPPADDSAAPDADGDNGTSSGGLQKPVITPIKDASSGFNKKSMSDKFEDVITFTKGDGKYAFDAGREPWYETAQLIQQYYHSLGKNYIAPWKLIPVGESDVVVAELFSTTLDKKKVHFVLGDGTALPAREVNGKWELKLPSVQSGETYEVFALYEDKKNKYETLGKLNVVSYPSQRKTVTLVAVNGSLPDVSWTERELNRIYNPYGIEITVKTDPILKNNTEWDDDKDGALNLNGSGFFTKETKEMRKLRTLYEKTATNYDRNAYYIFVMNRATAGDEPDHHLVVQGDMPRGKQFGYIFMDKTSNTPRLIAHELGHGMFTLRHSFDVNYSGDKFKSTTGNLMDYNNGEDLAVWQWNILAHPAPLTWFDSKDDAQSAERDKLLALKQQLASLGHDYAIFALKCNSKTPVDGKSILIGEFRYYLLKLNTKADGTISPEIVVFENIKTKPEYIDEVQLLPAEEAFLIRNFVENSKIVLRLSKLDIANYPAACDTKNLLDIAGFAKSLQKDLLAGELKYANDLLDQITKAVQAKLENKFFETVKLCVNISSSTGSTRNILTSGLTRCEDAELRIDIKIDAKSGEVVTSITQSENYLSPYVSALQREADSRGIKVSVESLRQQVLNDLRSKEVSHTFFDVLADKLKPLLSDKVATFVESVQASQKIVKNIWEHGEINKSTWYSKDSEHSQWPVYSQFHPLAGGVTDGVIDEMVGLPMACKDIYHLMSDEEQRAAFAQVFTKAGMNQMWEALKTEATETLNDTERLQHFGSKTVVQVSTVLTGGVSKAGAILTISKQVADNALPPKITKFIDKIRKLERYQKEKYVHMPDRIDKFFKSLSPDILEKLSNVPGFDRVMNDMAQHWGKFHGGKFQIEYAGRLIGEGKTISFEVSNLSDNLKRVYDIVIHSDNSTRRFVAHSLELKNWKQIYTKTIKSQLVKDIAKMKELGDIQWIFRKTAKNPFTEQSLRESIIETLKKADVKKELSNLFDENGSFAFKMTTVFKARITKVDDLIEVLNRPEKFNEIFKIVD